MLMSGLHTRRLYEADDKANAGTPKQDTPAPTPVPDTEPGNTQGETPASFTQDEVNRIAGERAKRASEAAISKLLEGLGLDSASDLKSLVSEAQKRKEAEMSEVEKLTARLEKLESEKKQALEAVEAAKAARIADKRNAAFKTAAKGAIDADVLLAWVESNKAEELAGTVEDDGTVSDSKMNALIKALQTEKPNLFGSRGAGSPSNAGGYLHNPQNTNAVKEAEDRLRQLMNK